MRTTTRFAWEAPDTCFQPRVMVCARMSGEDPDLKRSLVSDLAEVESAINIASEKRPVPWHVLTTAKEIPVPAGSAELTRAARKPLAQEVHAANLSAIDHSDCLISHAWGNGSAALGNIQRAFLEGPIRRPVFVLLSALNRKMSLEWEALEEEYCDLSIIDFDESPMLALAERLKEVTWDIEQAARAREAVHAQWTPIIKAVRDALGGEALETRASIARDLGRELASLQATLRSPMQFASMPGQRRDRLIERYNREIRRAVALDAAQTAFNVVERAAWTAWAKATNEQRAVDVLERELTARERVGIYAPRPQRRTPDSWEDLAHEFHL